MEHLPPQENYSAIDLNSYLAALPLRLEFDGKIFEDIDHAYFFWLSKYHPKEHTSDGVTIEELYEKNVLENGMALTVFYDYCKSNGITIPVMMSEDAIDFFNFEFQRYLITKIKEKDERYEEWAKDYGIPTNPGSIMRFLDTEGNEYRVRTDVENRGEIIVK